MTSKAYDVTTMETTELHKLAEVKRAEFHHYTDMGRQTLDEGTDLRLAAAYSIAGEEALSRLDRLDDEINRRWMGQNS